jgi:hypothetical protein
VKAGLPTHRRERGAREIGPPPRRYCFRRRLRSVGVWGPEQTGLGWLILLFTCFFAIPLPCQRLFHTAFFTGFEVEGMTFDFFNDVFLLDLALKPAQCIFKRLAFLNANLCQRDYTSRRPSLGNLQTTGNEDKFSIKEERPMLPPATSRRAVTRLQRRACNRLKTDGFCALRVDASR